MILFFHRHKSSLKKMRDLMEYLKGSSEVRKLLLIGNSKLDGLKKSQVIRINERNVKDPYKAIENSKIFLINFFKSKKLVNFFFDSLLFDFFKIIFLVLSYVKQTSFLKKILRKNNVKLIFLTGDRELGLIPPLIKAANQLEIKVIVYSTGILSVHNLGMMRKNKSYSPRLELGNNILNMICGLIFPLQTCKTNFGFFLFSKGWVTISLRVLNMLSSNPWIQGAGNSDFIFVENKKSLNTLKNFGVDKNKIKLVENIEYLNSINSDFKKKNKRIILFAIPIFFEHNFISWEKHKDELRKYLDVLADYSEDIFFSFHPKSKIENYEFIFTDFGFKKKIVSVLEIISKIDLYICGSSSTINLSIIHKKPTINLSYISSSDEEFYYKNIKFVKNVKTTFQFKKNLDMSKDSWDRLIMDSEKYLLNFFPPEKKMYKYIEKIIH